MSLHSVVCSCKLNKKIILCELVYSDKLANTQVNCNCLIFMMLSWHWEECMSANKSGFSSQSELTTALVNQSCFLFQNLRMRVENPSKLWRHQVKIGSNVEDLNSNTIHLNLIFSLFLSSFKLSFLYFYFATNKVFQLRKFATFAKTFRGAFINDVTNIWPIWPPLSHTVSSIPLIVTSFLSAPLSQFSN